LYLAGCLQETSLQVWDGKRTPQQTEVRDTSFTKTVAAEIAFFDQEEALGHYVAASRRGAVHFLGEPVRSLIVAVSIFWITLSFIVSDASTRPR
jgi:hypothetical protein